MIPNGVDAGRFASAAPGSRLGRYVLSVGGIEPRKGSIDLLEAYALALRTAPDLRLVIAGGETLFDYRDYRAAWEARAVAFRGARCPRPGGARRPAVAGGGRVVFGFPSVKEGFGLAAMEALAAGVPVVTRDLPVLREVFGDAVRYAADPPGFAGALLDALTSPDLLRAPGQKLAASYTWEAAAQAHLRFYSARLSPAAN